MQSIGEHGHIRHGLAIRQSRSAESLGRLTSHDRFLAPGTPCLLVGTSTSWLSLMRRGYHLSSMALRAVEHAKARKSAKFQERMSPFGTASDRKHAMDVLALARSLSHRELQSPYRHTRPSPEPARTIAPIATPVVQRTHLPTPAHHRHQSTTEQHPKVF